MNILETLKTGLSEGRITQSEYDLHQRLASELARLIDNGADDAEIASIHRAMIQILKKAE